MLHLSGEDGAAATYWVDGDVSVVNQLQAQGLPFEPMQELGRWTDDKTGREYAELLFRCTKLTDGGRCSIYQDRPALCRRYEPLSDRLCVHFGGSEAGADGDLA
jgi:Fe-S-cluster containining protein